MNETANETALIQSADSSMSPVSCLNLKQGSTETTVVLVLSKGNYRLFFDEGVGFSVKCSEGVCVCGGGQIF